MQNLRARRQPLIFACLVALELHISTFLQGCGRASVEDGLNPSPTDFYWSDFAVKLTSTGFQNVKQITALPEQLLGPMNAVAIASGNEGRVEIYPKPVRVGRIFPDSVTLIDTGTVAIDALFIGHRDGADCTIVVGTDAIFVFSDASRQSATPPPNARLSLKVIRANEPVIALFLK